MAQEGVTRRLAAIVAIDVVGYSRLMGEDEAGTLARLKERRAVTDSISEKHGGRIVGTAGDSVLLEFPSVVEAVTCAVEVQKIMAECNVGLPADQQMLYRIGINLGDVLVDGDDIFGDGVNVAARLEALAQPGEIWLSGTVHDHVKSKVDLAFEALGERQLKNIAEPVQVFRIVPEAGAARLPELKTVGENLQLPGKPSIAILPFKNLSNDPEQDHLADGFRLDIQAALIKIPELFLIANGTVNSFRAKDIDAEQVGRQLGVRYVLEGDIRKSGQRIRLNVQLTDCKTQQIIWGNQYDRVLDDTLAMSEEIAANVINEIGVTLIFGEESRIFQSTLKSFKAKDLFYQGLNLAWTLTRDGNIAARNLFERVAEIQPDSPVGPTYVSFSHYMDIIVGWSDAKDQSLRWALEWAEKALRFEFTNGLAHVVVAFDQIMKNHHTEALATSYKSVELRPNCPSANANLAFVLLYSGNAAHAIEIIKNALRLSPNYPVWFVNLLAAAYRDNGDLERSIMAAKRAIELNSANMDARMILCAGYIQADETDLAENMAQEVTAIDPDISVVAYIKNQPYKDQEFLSRLIVSLRESGLPE